MSLYISDIVPRKDVKLYNASQASSNFNNHIQQLGYFERHIALPPINVGNDYKSFKEKETGIEYLTCRLFPHKGVFKYINNMLENITLFGDIVSSKEKNVWFYNISKINFISFWLLSILSKKNLYVLMADYNPERNKGILGKLILKGIERAKGVISLTSRCGKINQNVICLPGIIPERKIAVAKGSLSSERVFMISGVLSKNTGIEMALEVFSEVPEATLVISGTGDSEIERLCKDYANRCSNIRYYGFIEKYEDFLSLLDKSDFILSFRDPAKPVNRYNFPSKILESLALNKVVISTQEYDEIKGINYLYVPYDKKSLTTYIRTIVSGELDYKIDRCLDNSQQLRERFTEKSWINAFKKLENDKNT